MAGKMLGKFEERRWDSGVKGEVERRMLGERCRKTKGRTGLRVRGVADSSLRGYRRSAVQGQELQKNGRRCFLLLKVRDEHLLACMAAI